MIQIITAQCTFQGLDKHNYLKLLPDTGVRSAKRPENWSRTEDHMFTDAALAYLKDLYQGDPAGREISSDAISGKFLIRISNT
ncbi:hypothetical protein A8C56_07410 [Niabella ginsenosidivorans]|uniref:Uncharacterized protein n=1 Tax=Niabella ginsenosidivorans TaxID=1176587 RepID=A0A1A9I291_9BACT|nr:hypothetical protein A8C56_07410 [Niabella ginsenosidivorans]